MQFGRVLGEGYCEVRFFIKVMKVLENTRSILRGLYYLFFRPAKGFITEEQIIKDKYYSYEYPLKKIEETTIIVMIDGRSIHGGLTDRLRGITTIYQYCKEKGLKFKLNYVYPFKLQDYLAPNSYNWIIEEKNISYNSEQTAVVVLNDYQLDIKLHRFYLDSKIRKNRGKQIHLYTNTYFFDNKFATSYGDLFVPTEPLQTAIEFNQKQIGKKYVAMVFRFQQLLGDFKEQGYKVLSKEEQEELVKKCIEKVNTLHEERHPDDIILVTSDSGRFLQEITRQLNYVRIIPGKLVHMDHTADAAFDTYMKSFEDMLLLSKADKIYLLQTGDMYHSGFAKRAAMINKKTYEEVVF